MLIAAGPCLGQVNTGIAIFEAPDQETARRIVAGEPVTGMVALHYPGREHWDEMIFRVRQAADVAAVTPAASRSTAGSAKTARPS